MHLVATLRPRPDRSRGRWTRLRLGALAATVMSTVLGATDPASAVETVRTRTIPRNIASDCSVDVTGRLNAWIHRVPNRSVLKFRKNGCYRVDGSVVVSGRRNLIFAGNGATLQAMTPGDRNRRHLWFTGGKNLEVRNLTVRGANPNAGSSRESYDASKAFQHAFAFGGVKNVRLDNVQAYDVYGDFVYIGPAGPERTWSQNVTVTNSRFEGSGRQGIAIVAGKHIVIHRNSIGGVGRSLFDLEANRLEDGAVDVRVTRNTTGAARNFWLANKGVGTQIRDIVFTGNTMTEPTGGLVFLFNPYTDERRGPYLFADNVLVATDGVHDEGSKGAFFLSRVADVTIRDNVVTFPLGEGVPAVENQDSLNVVVEGNTFTNAGETVITTVRPIG